MVTKLLKIRLYFDQFIIASIYKITVNTFETTLTNAEYNERTIAHLINFHNPSAGLRKSFEFRLQTLPLRFIFNQKLNTHIKNPKNAKQRNKFQKWIL